MVEPHVVNALREKRAEIAGIIDDMERRIAQHLPDVVLPRQHAGDRVSMLPQRDDERMRDCGDKQKD